MGRDERDYMRERPFTPPDDDLPFLMKVVACVAIGFLVYKALALWEARKQAQRHEPTPVQAALASPREVVRPVQAPAPAPVSEPSAAPSYVAPATTGSAETQRAEPRTGGTIYLCRDYGGGTFWASDHCNRHNALIDRMVSVPEGMPFAQQVQIAEERRRVLAAQTEAQVPATVSGPATQARSNKALCESLDNRVTTLDAMARQPQSRAMQDWIRSERQKTRDEQFRLRC